MNMAIDEAISTMVSEKKSPPTLRFYTWEVPTLSLGYFQKAEKEVDFAALKQQKLGFVRRATGGRAVLHDKELTYSMIVNEDDPMIPKTVTEAYRVLSEGLVVGFQTLGLAASMTNLASNEEKAKYSQASSAACFDAPSWYELVVEGKKIAGSAQTRQKGVVLQHGSILLDMDVDMLFSVLKFSNEKVRDRLKASFYNKAVAINDIKREMGQSTVALPEVMTAFQAGIAQGLGVTLAPATLTPEEEALAQQLVQEKYGHDDWNLKR
ncbi:lipoate--protein ligase family protein [Longirhabdus pacifica]|uniref:lipoate--protein ligase family protein n=1 Tax=Longirhabdus pacifica TaxID=2305227 RepID=UPI001F0CD4B8|nr:lipoate--protein ligase family protein [Longirhabdus pacifica]